MPFKINLVFRHVRTKNIRNKKKISCKKYLKHTYIILNSEICSITIVFCSNLYTIEITVCKNELIMYSILAVHISRHSKLGRWGADKEGGLSKLTSLS